MDIERFRAVASEIQAERFFGEKAASARVNPVALISVSRAADAEDPELLKVAAQFCPEAPLEFYEKRLFGKFKTSALAGSEAELLRRRRATETPGRVGRVLGAGLGALSGAGAVEHVNKALGGGVLGTVGALAAPVIGAAAGGGIGHLLGRQYNDEAGAAAVDRELIGRRVVGT